MIGWRPYLLSLLALLIVSVLVFDVAGVAIDDILDAIQRLFGRFQGRDWVLAVTAVYLVLWGWLRALATSRLGTIDIGELQVDGDALAPHAARAQLQSELAVRGLLPPSGVPSGSPTVAGLSAALSEAPIPQAKFLAALMTLIPTPPTSTAFRITGTLRASEGQVSLIYELDCVRPRRSVIVGEEQGDNATTAIAGSARAIYRQIALQAPGIYPVWARWASVEALTKYSEGLAAETGLAQGVTRPHPHATPEDPRRPAARYKGALKLYREASELDPENMLARIRTANCLERQAAGLEDDQRANRSVDALEAYVAVRLRQPAIFEAGFRASVLLSSLAEMLPTDMDRRVALRTVLRRLELESAREVDAADHLKPWRLLRLLWKWQGQLEWSVTTTPAGITIMPRSWRAVGRLVGRSIGTVLERLDREDEGRVRGTPGQTLEDPELRTRLRRACRREARLARHRLRPWWMVVHEKRFLGATASVGPSATA